MFDVKRNGVKTQKAKHCFKTCFPSTQKIDGHAEWSKVRQRQTWYCLFLESKGIQMNLSIDPTRHRFADVENKFIWLPGVKGGGGINWKIGIDIYTILYIK